MVCWVLYWVGYQRQVVAGGFSDHFSLRWISVEVHVNLVCVFCVVFL